MFLVDHPAWMDAAMAGTSNVSNPLKRKSDMTENKDNPEDTENIPPKKVFETIYYDEEITYSDIFVLIDLTLEDAEKRLNDLVLYDVLKKLNLLEGIVDIKKIGFRRSKVKLTNPKNANNIVTQNKKLEEHNLKAFIPINFVHKVGIIRDVPVNFSEKDIEENLLSDIKIKAVSRFTRVDSQNNEKRIPTETVKVTFYGNNLPESVILFFCRRKVEYFVPNPKQCKKCGRLGHLERMCKAKQFRCLSCGNNPKCNPCVSENQVCILCGNNDHKCFDDLKKCPKKREQKKMAEIMAIGNFSYNEAISKYNLQSTANRFSILTDNEYEQNFPEISQKNNKNKPSNQPKNNTLEINKVLRKDKTYKQALTPQPSNLIPAAEPLNYGNQSVFSIPFEAVSEAERFINSFFKTVMTTARVSENDQLIKQIEVASQAFKNIARLHDEAIIFSPQQQSTTNGKSPTI